MKQNESVILTNMDFIFSYVMNQLAVLTIVYLERDNTYRIISFRTASKTESEVYYEWLAN